jgi:nucleoside-diphosphate-sugar epimerase
MSLISSKMSRIDELTRTPTATSRSGLDDEELRQLVRDNETLFKALSGASILITGATGWFGVWMLDVLCTADDMLELGIKLAPVSREPRRFLQRFPKFVSDPRISWIKADIRQLDSKCGHFSHMIHAATDTSTTSDPEASRQVFDTIVEGTRRAVAAVGPHCQSFLLLSSGAVYGPAGETQACFVESDVSGPDPSLAKNAYAEGKRAAEMIAAIAASAGTPVRIARCFAFVGPHMPFDTHFAIGNFIADAVHGRPIQVKSDGRPQRSYLYMTDLMRALFTILCHGSIGKPYNVGSDISLTIEQLANCVDRVVGGCGVHIGGAPSDPRDRYVPDIGRLQRELSFVPGVELDQAVARTAAWYRARIGKSMPL